MGTDFRMMRAIGCAAVVLMGAGPALAQEVHVYSFGKPYAINEEVNASFAPARDERKARRPLAERADAGTIAAAHSAAFLHCGLSESKYPAAKVAAPEELNYFAREATYIPIPHTKKIILLGEYVRGKAIVDLDKHKVLTPQCPAGVRTMFWSYNADRVVFATQAVTGINFYGESSALWTAKFNPAQDLYYFDSTHAGNGFRKLMSLPDEKVLDVLLPDNTDHMWVLSQTERIDLRSPGKWLRAASGNASSKMDVTLRKVDLKGTVLETIDVARSVPDGTAQFARE
ncbi:MAG: hypothetical protein V4631_00760 [Pseudomonadota bacterium]